MTANLRLRIVLVALFLTVGSWNPAAAQTSPSQPEPASGVTIAIMDFESKAPGNPDFGHQVAEILTVRLSMLDAATVVDRSRLTDVLEEQKLKLRGLTDQEQAAEVGKLLGAQIMVFGKIFPVGGELYVTMKLIGVETGQLKGAIAKGKMTEDLSVILDRATDELVKRVEMDAATLLPAAQRTEDPLSRLADRLSGKTLPAVAVVIPESHVTRRIPDPAAETEIKRLLYKLGFPVASVDESALGEWAKSFRPKDPSWPSTLDNVDIVVVGEAFSEMAGTYQGLISCSARAEVRAVDRKTGKVLAVTRTTQRAVDLSENIAAKTALQKCGHVAGLEIAEKLTDLVTEAGR
jgi:TolB-like protein